LVECLPSKQNVVGSSPIIRSIRGEMMFEEKKVEKQGKPWKNLYARTFEQADLIRKKKLGEGFEAKVKRLSGELPAPFVVKFRKKHD
jgi:hypothetical protein